VALVCQKVDRRIRAVVGDGWEVTMRPLPWQPPIPRSRAAQAITHRLRRAKRFGWRREPRHERCDAPVQAALAVTDGARPCGQPPVPPVQLARVTLRPADVGCAADAVIAATTMDRRGQLALDGLDCVPPPFRHGRLVAFRQRLIAHDRDRRLSERTIALARQRGGIGRGPLRAVLDASPRWGAGRGEDPANLVGHAVRKAVGVSARPPGRAVAAVAPAAGADLGGGASRKAARDRDGADPAALTMTRGQVRATLPAGAAWRDQPDAAAPMAPAVVAQEGRPPADGAATGVAPERRIRVEDAAMRQGRQRRTVLGEGGQRHWRRDLDRGRGRTGGVTAATVPAATVTHEVAADRARQGVTLGERPIARVALSRRGGRERGAALTIDGRAWPVQHGPHFPKTAFALAWDQPTIRCPQGQTRPCGPGGTVPCAATTGAAGPGRDRCPTSTAGRRVRIHPDERRLAALRERQLTPGGRATWRARVAVAHRLAHLGHWQGDRAR
jgi:transposase